MQLYTLKIWENWLVEDAPLPVERPNLKLLLQRFSELITAICRSRMLIRIKLDFANVVRIDHSRLDQGLKFSFGCNLECVIKISLLCLLIVKNVGIHTILVNDNAELVTEKTSLPVICNRPSVYLIN